MNTDPQTDQDPESARSLLYRHGLPEDVIDGVLCLHAQELAAVQRREAAVWGVDTAPGRHILEAADLIDPTRTQPAVPEAAPPTGQAGLREQVAAALYEHEWPAKQVWVQALAMDREAFLAQADAVLPVLPADSGPHRLALSTVLGLGTGAPWDAIRERAAELAGLPAPVDRASIYRELADRQTQLAVADDLARRRDVAGARRQLVKQLRRLAAETSGPETQATAEPWLTDSARIGRTLIWSWADVGQGAFREGYRAAQAEARALLGGERGTDHQQPAVVTEPGKDPS